MERNLLKKELRELKYYYANVDIFKDFPEKIKLVDKYKSAVCDADNVLITFFVYYYVENNDLHTVAENMQISIENVNRLSRKLKMFFMKNL